MKVALCVFPIQHDIQAALNTMVKYIAQAADQNCNLIVFPEACLTGIDLSSNYEEDSKLGLSIDSKEVKAIQKMAIDYNIHLAFGYLEIANEELFDSAMIINNEGEILLDYRRHSGTWVDSNANSDLYCCGDTMNYAQTKLGKTAFLICGDIFTPGIIEKAVEEKPDIVIFIMARSFLNTKNIQQQWDTIELPHYIDKWKKLEGTVLSVNLLEIMDLDNVDIYCGGAYIVNQHGHILASKPLLEAGLLIYQF